MAAGTGVTGPLRLRDLKSVATGRQCYVFVHPLDASLIVKVITPDYAWKRSRRGGYYGRWHKNFVRRHLNFVRVGPFLGFLRELREHLAVRAVSDVPIRHMQSVVGLVETDMGLGLVSRAVRTADGKLAPNLATLLKNDLFDASARRHLDEFIEWLLGSPVVICDLNPGNIVYGYTAESGQHFVLIDGIGEKNFLPFSSLSARLNRRSKLRRIRRLIDRIEALQPTVSAAPRENRKGGGGLAEAGAGPGD